MDDGPGSSHCATRVVHCHVVKADNPPTWIARNVSGHVSASTLAARQTVMFCSPAQFRCSASSSSTFQTKETPRPLRGFFTVARERSAGSSAELWPARLRDGIPRPFPPGFSLGCCVVTVAGRRPGQPNPPSLRGFTGDQPGPFTARQLRRTPRPTRRPIRTLPAPFTGHISAMARCFRGTSPPYTCRPLPTDAPWCALQVRATFQTGKLPATRSRGRTRRAPWPARKVLECHI